jgi:anaerobic selenocysteine-containing dehydrogenase
MNGFSLCLLCAVVGNLDAVGGICGANAAGPDWSPQEGPDGLIVPSKAVTLRNPGYPPAPVGRPANLGLQELLPIAVYAGPFYVMSSLNPNMFGLEYKPEMLIVARANPLHTGADIETTVEFLKKFKFIVSFATRIDETAEFADVVLPDTVFCERLAPFINYGGGGRQWQMFDIGGCRTSAQRCKPATPWYWTWMVPVVKPQPEARDWIEVLYELAKRVGFQRELYNTLNDFLRLREPYRLGAEGEYSWAEIVDRWARSWCGEQYGLEYFMKHGFLVYGYHTVKQVYWRYFHRVRCPVYFEHFIEVGRRVLEVVEELGVPWDVSDYRPLPDWIPCPGYTRQLRGYDLYATPFKHPKHGFSHTYNNPWLKETILRDPYLTSVLINSETAESRGLRTGDEVWVESQSGKIRGRVLVTELVHPEVVGIAGQGGLWSSGQPVGREVGLHYNRLLKLDLTTIDNVGAAVDTCVRVKVYKVEEKP